MKKFILTAAALLMLAGQGLSQRVMDKLDRGVVAVKADNGVFVSWRVLGHEADNVKFNLYRDGAKLNDTPLSVSNFSDASGTTGSSYEVKTVVNGVETSTSKKVSTLPNNYIEIKIAPVPSNKDGRDISADYEPNDATVADLDGDGEMEILLKLRNTKFHSQGYPLESTDFDIIQVYQMDGTLMWWIDCGRNMVDFQSNEINIAAYDWDLDGKAECVLRAADGTTIHFADGTKQVIGDPKVNTLPDVRNNGMTEKFTHSGAEYFLYLNGETGKPYTVMDYPLRRLEKGESSLDSAWGDGYGHRSSKHFFGAPYLDGRKPSIFLARGIYTRHKMIAYDVDPATHNLTERWSWVNNQAGSPWFGQGYHNYCVGDVDWDGRDEIVFGSMVIDDNGRGLSTTGLGHGDSQHLGDFNPYIYGQEFVACNEDNPNNNYRDATTSKIYYRTVATSDDGRAIAGNFSNKYPGSQFITSHDSQTLISTVINAHLKGATGTDDVAQNFRIFWDGDLLDETFNYSNGKNTAGAIYKYGVGVIYTFQGTMTNNDTKGTPCFQGDIFGDWREEIMLRADDNRSVRIYTTTIPTEHRLYTLLHDPQYRNAMVWQMNGYNQTPHVSYFVGELEGITQAPPAPTLLDREELMPGGSIAGKGKSYMFAHIGNATASVAEGAAPDFFIDNTPSWVQGHQDNDNITREYFTHTLTGGAFAGDMKLVKIGAGTLVLPAVKQKYTGDTEVWFGTLSFDGEMTGSRVWLNRLTALNSNGGKFGKGLEMDYGACLNIGTDAKAGEITASELVLNFGSRVCIDLFAEGTAADRINASTLKIEKKVWENGPEYATPVFEFKTHLAAGQTKLPAGEYILGAIAAVEGNLSDIVVEGLSGQKATLAIKDGKLILTIFDAREATDIVWTGANGSIWDLDESENFKIRSTGEATTFVAGDRVIFDDDAITTDINLPAEIYPSQIVFNNSEKDFTITGGSITGNCNIEKRGTGTVTLSNLNSFTGTITIDNGTLAVATLGANEGAATGSLGHYNNPITLNGGGMLSTAFTGKMSHPITANEGGIEVKSGTLTIAGTSVTGNGTFIKAGAGQINFTEPNKLSVLRIDDGTVYDEGDKHQLAKTVVFNGKKSTLKDQNSCYSSNSDNTNYVVNEGMKGYLSLDGRCNYTGKLTGKGTLEVFAPWIRNELRGNWSEFEGTIIASQETNKNNTVGKYGSDFQFFSSYGLPLATLQIKSGCTFNDASSSARNNMKLGALTGTGTLGGSGTYYIGGLNKDGAFQGTFGENVNIVKEGTGTMILTAINEKMGTLTIQAGAVKLSNTTDGTITGTKTLKVYGTLTGWGTAGNRNAEFKAGSVIEPTGMNDKSNVRTISFGGNVTLEQGTALNLGIVSATNYARITVDGELDNNASVNVTLNKSYKPAVGDEFTFWTAASGSEAPAINLPVLPEGLYWDVRDVTPTAGLVKVTDTPAGVGDIAADRMVECTVVTLDGIVVKEFTAAASQAAKECDGLTPGVYVITMKAESYTNTQKIVVK